MTGNREDGPTAVAEPRDAGPVSETSEESALDRQLAERLYDLLQSADLERRDLEYELDELRGEYGDRVYVELIYLLCHLRFEDSQARVHWDEIVAHREDLERRAGAPVDLRVALVSYFLHINRRYRNPKIIELQLFEQTRASVYRDDLTGLYNHRFFGEQLTREVRRSLRSRAPVSLIMIDVDDFKAYNDAWGHEAGNEILRSIGGSFADAVRKTDMVTRYGGEEFAIILPDTPKIGARSVAERIRADIEERFAGRDGRGSTTPVTVSLGVATCPADAEDASELVRRADGAMYLAKQGGKNAVRLHGEDVRSFARHDAALLGSFRALESEERCLTTVNVSEGGILFVSERRVAIGTPVEADLALPGERRSIRLLGRVVSVHDRDDGQAEMGLRIVEIGREDLNALSRYLAQARLATIAAE